MATFDALVIGGGPAGLAGALYLARFRRSVCVIDAGDSRAARIPRSHNVAGFPAGIRGDDLIAIMQRQVRDLRVPIVRDRIERLVHDAGQFHATGSELRASARCVLLATGARDIEPAMPDVQHALEAGALRYCPVCDGYEVHGRVVGVLCDSAAGAREALYLRHFTPRVEVFVTHTIDFPAHESDRLRGAGIVLHREPVRALRLHDHCVVITLGETQRTCDSLYSALGIEVHSALATALDASCDDDGYLVADRHQQTCVPGLYCAGDVARGLNQISVGVGEAAIAASAMHIALGHTPA